MVKEVNTKILAAGTHAEMTVEYSLAQQECDEDIEPAVPGEVHIEPAVPSDVQTEAVQGEVRIARVPQPHITPMPHQVRAAILRVQQPSEPAQAQPVQGDMQAAEPIQGEEPIQAVPGETQTAYCT